MAESFRTNRTPVAQPEPAAPTPESLEAYQSGNKDFLPVPKKRLRFECTKIAPAAPSDYSPDVPQVVFEWEVPEQYRKASPAPEGYDQSWRVTQYVNLKTGITGKRSKLYELVAGTLPIDAEGLLDAWCNAGGPLVADWLQGLTIEAQVDHKERPGKSPFAFFKQVLQPDSDDPVAQEQLEILKGYMRAKNPAIYARITGDTSGAGTIPVARPSRNTTSPELPV